MKRNFSFLLCFLMACTVRAQKNGSYVNNHASIAQQLMYEYHIPASLILGVAIHESAAGQSKVARNLHNHFGIKGKNEVKSIHSAYKSYPNSKASYQHFVKYISKKTYFASLQNQPVEKWVRKIHSGYAKSRTWAAQVIQIIKKYNLKQFDKGLYNPSNNETEYTVKKTLSSERNIHKVRKGETLSSIAKKYHTQVSTLKRKNHLNSSKISIGQRIKI